MRKVLVTGARGFIGKNLVAHLGQRGDIEVLGIDIEDGAEALAAAAVKADFVFHLAGVNRPKDPAEFDRGNRGLTEELIGLLKAKGSSTPLLLSSSIQASLDNPYGTSKRGAEALVKGYGDETGARVYRFRLPNVFGKWCRPNYNSVVATWCHNSATGLPIQINDPTTMLTLVYVDDVVSAFIRAMDGEFEPGADGFCSIETSYSVSLGSLAKILEDFVASRKTLVMPSLADDFVRRLYGTWLSYLPERDFSYPLEMKRDERGWLAEFIKSASFGQVFISRTKPGITRGRHWHHSKVEKFLVISGSAVIRFRKIDGSEVIEYPVNGDELRVVDIPVGYTHSIRNCGEGDLVTLFWADEIFDQSAPDTFFLEV